MKPGGKSIPILESRWWLHIPTGRRWREHRFHRGRVVMRLEGALNHEIRLYRLADDPGTGGAVLGAPYWIRTATPQTDTNTRPALSAGGLT